MRYIDACWPANTEVPATTEVPANTEIDATEGAEKMLELFFGPAIITIACSLTMSAEGEMVAKNTRVIRNAALMVAEGEMSANAKKYRVDQLEFTGEFAPGDVIVIDCQNMRFIHNGQVKNRLKTGDFIELGPGVSGIRFEDNETNRTVFIRVSHRDRYL